MHVSRNRLILVLILPMSVFIIYCGQKPQSAPPPPQMEVKGPGSTPVKAEPPRPTTWQIELVGQKLLATLKTNPDLTKEKAMLAVKVSLDYRSAGDAVIEPAQIRLTTKNGPAVTISAIGGGKQEFGGFNFYSFDKPSYANKIDYIEDEKSKPSFGLTWDKRNQTPSLTFYQKRQIVQLGFLVPKTGGQFELRIGDSNPLPVTATP